MCSPLEISRQVARLNGLARYPRKPEGLGELGRAFQQAFSTEVQLERAVTNILRTSTECPTPSVIYGGSGRTSASVGCPDCDEGWIIRQDRMDTLDGSRVLERAYRCHCRPPIPE